MAEMIIRPTMKFLYLGYLLVIVIVVASVVALMRVQQWPSWIPAGLQPWIPWLPVLLLLWPLKRHLRNRLTKMIILDDRVRYETGFLGQDHAHFPDLESAGRDRASARRPKNLRRGRPFH